MFEAALEQFLATERGLLKLSGPLTAALSVANAALTQDIPQQLVLLTRPLNQLRQQYLEARPQLDALSARRKALLSAIEQQQGRLVQDLHAALALELERIYQEIPTQTQQVDPGLWTTIRSKREAQRQVADHLLAWLQTEIGAWQKSVVEPLVHRHMQDLEQLLQQHVGDFLSALGNLRDTILPGLELPEGEELTPLSRVLGALGGLLVGGPGAILEGAGYGFSHLLRAAGYHLALTLGLLVAGAGTPLVLGASMALGVARSVVAGNRAVENVRKRVEEDLIRALQQDQPRLERVLAEQVAVPFGQLRTELDRSLGEMVQRLEGAIQRLLQEQELGEAKVALERARLIEEQTKLQTHVSHLQAIHAEILDT